MDPIPEDVREFLRLHVNNLEQLETLLLILQNPDARWTSDAVADELSVSIETAAQALDALTAEGLVERVNAIPHDYHRTAVPPALAQSLEEAYETSRIDLINLMSSHAVDRVRTSAFRAFSAAFRFRGKPEG